jgi:hypothetical protein
VFNGFFLVKVCCYVGGFSLPQRIQFFTCLFAGFGVSGGNVNFCAVLYEAFGYHAADAFCAAGYEDDFVLEALAWNLVWGAKVVAWDVRRKRYLDVEKSGVIHVSDCDSEDGTTQSIKERLGTSKIVECSCHRNPPRTSQTWGWTSARLHVHPVRSYRNGITLSYRVTVIYILLTPATTSYALI